LPLASSRVGNNMKFRWIGSHHAPALAGVMGTLACAVALLTACGGQGSATSPTNSPGTLTNGSQSSTLAGGYQGTVPYSDYNSEFVSFVTPSLDWYALYYLQTTTVHPIYPIIIKGHLNSITSDSATINSPGLTVFQYSEPKLSSGGARITNASAQEYKLDLNGIKLPTSVDLSVQATTMTTYTTLAGPWEGSLTDNFAGYADLPLTFSSSVNGTFTSNKTSYANCPVEFTLTPESQTSRPYFSAVVSIAANTGCSRTPGTMSGIGFIHASTLSGRTRRLELILTDGTGSGLSFRGDQ